MTFRYNCTLTGSSTNLYKLHIHCPHTVALMVFLVQLCLSTL